MSGSNNFLVFDENNENILSDVDYSSDAQRQGGVIPGLAKSNLHNKLFRQVSIMAAALGEVIKSQGLAANDADLTALKGAISDAFIQPLLTHEGDSSAHGATSAATSNKIMLRDSNGRAKVSAPSASDDIARKDNVDAVQSNLNTHLADKTPHDVPTANISNSANQSIPNNTETVLAFNQEAIDTDNMHDIALNNSKLIIKTAGRYIVYAVIAFAANVTGYREARIKLNGVTNLAINNVNAISVAGATTRLLVQIPVRTFGVNDELTISVIQDSGGALDIISGTSTSFVIVKVG